MAPISVELFHSGGMERILQHSWGPLGLDPVCWRLQLLNHAPKVSRSDGGSEGSCIAR